MQFTINSFLANFPWQDFFPDISLIFSKIPDISLTAVKFHDISRLSRQVVTLLITYKLCTIVYKCLHGAAPSYLTEMCVPVAASTGRRFLRSMNTHLTVPVRYLTRPLFRKSVFTEVIGVTGLGLWWNAIADFRNSAPESFSLLISARSLPDKPSPTNLHTISCLSMQRAAGWEPCS